MNEQNLIQAAESGDVSAMLKLAEYYAKKSKGGGLDDKVGDVISVEDFAKMIEAQDDDYDDKSTDEFKALAYQYYRMAAEAGDAKSMTEVARRLWDGIGVKEDTDESKVWYRRAAEAGDPAAMRSAAYLSDDDAEKFKWYKLSAELDKPGFNKEDSIRQTAINYACGKGTEKDVAKAEEWLAKLDEQSRNSAMSEIAHTTGDNSWLERAAQYSEHAMIEMAEKFVLTNDFATALSWYKKAADKGLPDAMSIVGDIYYIGEDGVEQDYAQAFQWYSKAAEHGYNMAKIKMTLMIYRGLGTKQDLPLAFKNFSEISWTRENFGGFGDPLRFNSVARYFAAKMSENGEGCSENPAETLERYKVAGGLERIHPNESARSIPKAIYKVADAYFLGKGTKQSFGKALKFYEKTLKGGGRTPHHREAIKKVMWMYELGEGIPQDKAKAAEWREKLN